MTDAGNAAPQPLDIGDVRFITRGLSASEQATVLAVLGATVGEEFAQASTQAASGPDAWARSQRQLRAPLRPGAHAWRSFSG